MYACSINEEKIVATGCYDKVIRIWQKSKKYILKQELEAHKGYVTSLVFNKKGNILFSSDSIGIVLAWNKCDQDWCLKRFETITMGSTINLHFQNNKTG